MSIELDRDVARLSNLAVDQLLIDEIPEDWPTRRGFTGEVVETVIVAAEEAGNVQRDAEDGATFSVVIRGGKNAGKTREVVMLRDTDDTVPAADYGHTVDDGVEGVTFYVKAAPKTKASKAPRKVPTAFRFDAPKREAKPRGKRGAL